MHQIQQQKYLNFLKMINKNNKLYAIFSLGQPMIVFTASVNEEFLNRYKLVENSNNLGNKENKSIYTEINNKDNFGSTVGGSELCTIMTVSCALKDTEDEKYKCFFIGCVGEDNYASMIREKAQSLGICLKLHSIKDIKTTICATLLTKQNRTMVCHYGAGHEFKTEMLDPYLNDLQRSFIVYLSVI